MPAEVIQELVVLDNLGVDDPMNTPIVGSPGHTDEPNCPEKVSLNLSRQLDLTETYVGLDSCDLLAVASFYNVASEAQNTDQYWFFDLDNDMSTGGGDAVPPSGTAIGGDPKKCAPYDQAIPLVYSSGFELYVHSYGQREDTFRIYRWFAGEWQELPVPATAVNHHGKMDNPANPYLGDNGYRAVCGLPLAELGFSEPTFTISVRSWSPVICCGDNMGGEGQIVIGPTDCTPPETLCGDCDGNGFVDVLDALLAARMASALALEPSRWSAAASFSACNPMGEQLPSGSARISVLDALAIARYVVGLTELACCF